MKHTFTFVFFVFAISSFSQTEKGNSFISGNISTGYSVNAYPKAALTKSNYFSFSTGVSYGKFVKDNIVWRNSLYGGFDRIFNQTNDGSQVTATILPTTVSLSSVGLYYFGKDRWRGFVGGGINFNGNFNKTKNTCIDCGTLAESSIMGIDIIYILLLFAAIIIITAMAIFYFIKQDYNEPYDESQRY